MRTARIYGHLLLWLGFLAGAFATVRSVEVEANPWSTIFWPAYLAALGVAVVGVVVLRATRRGSRAAAEHRREEVAELLAILDRLHGTIHAWSAAPEEIGVCEYHRMIDDRLVGDLGRFADLREAMIAAFGLDRYATVMTEFALAERTINRIWSASADGYVDEVHSSLVRAEDHLGAARDRLREAVAAS